MYKDTYDITARKTLHLSYVNFLENCRKNSEICSTDENQLLKLPIFLSNKFNLRYVF